MQKLTREEHAAIYFLDREGRIVLGDRAHDDAGQVVQSALDSLVRKKRAVRERTDDGPAYSLSAIGRQEIQ